VRCRTDQVIGFTHTVLLNTGESTWRTPIGTIGILDGDGSCGLVLYSFCFQVLVTGVTPIKFIKNTAGPPAETPTTFSMDGMREYGQMKAEIAKD
jgi:hypothetical protein